MAKKHQRRVNPISAKLGQLAPAPSHAVAAAAAAILPPVVDEQDEDEIHASVVAASPSPAPSASEVLQAADNLIDVPHPAVTDTPRIEAAYVDGFMYSFRLRLRGDLAKRYESIAVAGNVDAEEVMEDRLRRFVDAPSTPLQFNDAERREIMQLLGTADPESVLRHIRQLVTFRTVDPSNPQQPADLVFTAQQLERIGFRATRGETAVQKLQEYCNYGIDLQTGLG